MYNYKFFKIYRFIIFFFIINSLYIKQYIPSVIAVDAVISKINTLEQNQHHQQQERIAQLCAAQQSCSSCLQTPTCIWCAAVMVIYIFKFIYVLIIITTIIVIIQY